MSALRVPNPRRLPSAAGRLLAILIVAQASLMGAESAESAEPAESADPYLWLEDVEGERALAWVAAQNRESEARLTADPRFAAVQTAAYAVYAAADRIPYAAQAGQRMLNFWQDQAHVRGLLRSAEREAYLAGEPAWETLLDLDQLAEAEGENWVYKGVQCLQPEARRCLLRLSRGGGDAVTVREFDLDAKRFVTDGFVSSEAKQSAAWLDADRLLIAKAGDGFRVTDSGYAAELRLWRRGEPLQGSQLLLSVPADHVAVSGAVLKNALGTFPFAVDSPTFFEEDVYYLGNALGDPLGNTLSDASNDAAEPGLPGRGAGLADESTIAPGDRRLVGLGHPIVRKLPLPPDVDWRGLFQDRVVGLTRSEWHPALGAATPAGSAPRTAAPTVVAAESSAAGAAGKTAGEPVGEPSSLPIGEPSSAPISETPGTPTGEAIGQPFGEPLGEPAGQSLGQPFGEPSGNSSGEPFGKPFGKPIPAGALFSIPLSDLLAGQLASLEVLVRPTARRAVTGVQAGRSSLYVSVTEDVVMQLLELRPQETGWGRQTVPLPANGSLSIVSASPHSDLALVNFEAFLKPDTLYAITPGKAPKAVAQLPARFDAAELSVRQTFATSSDGVKVPCFIIEPKRLSGPLPTLLYGYGGFEIALTPSYLSPLATAWLQAGGVFAIANIRGGGEYGPRWHQAALGPNRQRAYDDFAAVAEHLAATGVTRPQQLGIYGGSNGGLLVGVAFTQRPELFGAAVSAVPLLDMLRYDKLLAGASWTGEYGDPDDPEARRWLAAYSPYQNTRPDAAYPPMFLTTSTKDDRVHPGHARKMAARLKAQGHAALYYENTEGGHSAAANLAQLARRDALVATFLMQELMAEPNFSE